MKKKKLVMLAGMSVLALGLALNLQYAQDDYGMAKSTLHLEVLAQTNSSGSGTGSGTGTGTHETNSFFEWFSQGITKDEREERRVCPSSSSSSGSASGSYGGASGSVSGSSTQTNPDGRYEYICPYGYANCSRIKC